VETAAACDRSVCQCHKTGVVVNVHERLPNLILSDAPPLVASKQKLQRPLILYPEKIRGHRHRRTVDVPTITPMAQIAPRPSSMTHYSL
jgi:hypothetical protein